MSLLHEGQVAAGARFPAEAVVLCPNPSGRRKLNSFPVETDLVFEKALVRGAE